MPSAPLPRRPGSRPVTTSTNPHMQLDQHPSMEILLQLAAFCFGLPDVEERPSLISVPGARALWLREEVAEGPREAFLIAREFAHIHPLPDGSLHAALPPDVAYAAVEQGWAEPHVLARFGIVPPSIVMLYAPRDAAELRIVSAFVAESRRFAAGADQSPERTRDNNHPSR